MREERYVDMALKYIVHSQTTLMGTIFVDVLLENYSSSV